jgi:hypothetical protein
MRRPQLRPQPLPKRAALWLWSVATLDMVVLAWMIAAGRTFDETSKLTRVVTLGGHHNLVLIMALIGFLMLVGLAVSTSGFVEANGFQVAVIILACAISIVANAGALSAIFLIALIAFLLGIGARLLLLLLLLLLRR